MNHVDPDQSLHNALPDQIYNFCHSSSIFFTHLQVVKWTCSNFRTGMVGSGSVKICRIKKTLNCICEI